MELHAPTLGDVITRLKAIPTVAPPTADGPYCRVFFVGVEDDILVDARANAFHRSSRAAPLTIPACPPRPGPVLRAFKRRAVMIENNPDLLYPLDPLTMLAASPKMFDKHFLDTRLAWPASDGWEGMSA